MRLSTKGHYGARAILELALNYERGIISLHEIAQKQGISESYLERMMTALVAAGLVTSSRGKHGGFRLTKPPGEIQLSQVIQIVEGGVTPVPCVDDPELCNRVDTCITRDIWERLKKAMLEILDSITLQDMVEMQKEKLSKPKTRMYYI